MSVQAVLMLQDLITRGRRWAAMLLRPGWRATQLGWTPSVDWPFRVRAYQTYAQYVRHQQTKLEAMLRGRAPWLQQYDMKFARVLQARLAGTRLLRPGLTVLCLGARIGTEVRAFHGLGCFAVGDRS